MAFNLGDRSPDNLFTALGQAIADKDAREEKPVAFGYDGGSPVRFAGTALSRRLGGDGEFWRMANDRADKDAQGYLKTWAQQYTSGMFSPFSGGPAPEETA